MLFFLRNLLFLHTGDYEIDIYIYIISMYWIYIHYFYVLDIYTLFLCTRYIYIHYFYVLDIYIYIISMYWISGNKI
jgi:hypothetical protein